MKALRKLQTGAGHLSLEECPVPVAEEGQILIKVRAVAVCGSDLHMRDGTFACSPPFTLGHEISGTVEALGPGVAGWEKGEAVTTETYFHTCGHCKYCTTGHQNMCVERKSIGTHVNGGMAEYVVVPAHRVHRLPEGLSFEEGATIEPFICCVQATLGKVSLQPGDPVLVSGPGVMGLYCVEILHAIGCRVVVTGTAKDSRRLELAKTLGADETLYVESEDLVGQIRKFSREQGVVASFECSGAPASVTTCLDALQKRGTMIQVALPEKLAPIDLSALTCAEKTIMGSYATLPIWWEKGIQLLEENPDITLQPMISETFPLADWEKAFAATEARQGFKYVMIP